MSQRAGWAYCGKDGRITKRWLRDLEDWLSQLVLETKVAETAKDERGSAPICAHEATANQAGQDLRFTAHNTCGDSESPAIVRNNKPEPTDSVNSLDLSALETMSREKEPDDGGRNQETSSLDSLAAKNDAELDQLQTLLLENIRTRVRTKKEAEVAKSVRTATCTEEPSASTADQEPVLNAVEGTESPMELESSLVDDHHIRQMNDNNIQNNTVRPSNDGVPKANSDHTGSETSDDDGSARWLYHEVAWRVAQARLVGSITRPTLRRQWEKLLTVDGNAT